MQTYRRACSRRAWLRNRFDCRSRREEAQISWRASAFALLTSSPTIFKHALTLICVWVFFSVACASADDWPQWRGPNRDGICAETGLLKQWPLGGPRLLWRATGLGNGYSTLAVVSNRIFTVGEKD